jgi:hypothetical protein
MNTKIDLQGNLIGATQEQQAKTTLGINKDRIENNSSLI